MNFLVDLSPLTKTRVVEENPRKYIWSFEGFFLVVDLQCSVHFCCTATWPSIHTYTFFLSSYLPSWSIPRDWIGFPVLYSRTSWLIHFQQKSLHPLAPKSQSIPRNTFDLTTSKLSIIKEGSCSGDLAVMSHQHMALAKSCGVSFQGSL